MTCVVRAWSIDVDEFRGGQYVARTRGKALAAAWQDYQILGPVSFGEFLRRARCRLIGDQFEAISVAGKPAYRVGTHGQYVRFVRPDSDVVLLAHPADVDRR